MRVLFFAFSFLLCHTAPAQNKTYYVDASGDDHAQGTIDQPWKTVDAVNHFDFEPGDTLFFTGGQTFGPIELQADDSGLTLTSYNGVATVGGLFAYNVGDITIDGLNFYGTGPADNTIDGVDFYMDADAPGDLNNIILRNITVSNFGGNGVLIGAWSTNNGYNNVVLSNANLNGNGIDGFASYGYNDVINHTNLHIYNVKSYQNYGHLDITNYCTGSGFTVSGFDGGIIENCEAYENGKNNRNSTGGPQGFWCYNARNLIFQYCTSHDNKAGLTHDGGGFDIDGGSQNCTIQYCYSYNNEGAGLALFEYGSSNQFTGNIIRYNISQNDARRNSHGGFMMWASTTSNLVKNSQVYNNTIYVSPSSLASSGYPAGLYFKGSNFNNVSFYNNIIYTLDPVRILSGSTTGSTFSNNDYYTPGKTANFTKGGISKDPLFVNAGGGKEGFVLRGPSPVVDAGKANGTTQDIIGTPVPLNNGYDMGAYESSLKPPVANAGMDQSIILPTNGITLDGGSSSDADGTIIGYSWTQIFGPSTFLINVPNAASTTVSNLVQGTYLFRLTVLDNDGISRFDDVQVVVNPVAGSKVLNINIYGGSNPYKNVAWNNWNVSASKSMAKLKYTDGITSTVSVAVSASSGIGDNGSSYGGMMAPPEVLRYTSYSGSSRTLTISGLSTTKSYNLEFYASRNNTGNKTTFSIGSQSVTIVTDKNKTNAANFSNLHSNTSGQIIVSITKTGTYNYLNGFILTEVGSATSAARTNVYSMMDDRAPEAPQVQVYPNPTQTYFTLHLNDRTAQPVQLYITNELGQTIETKKVAATGIVVFGETYTPGVYYAQLIQGNRRTVLKLIKGVTK